MSYSGKVDAKLHTDGLGDHFGAYPHVEAVHAAHVPSDAIVIPDAQLLFGAEFKRAGVDLVLSGEGRELVLHDYFRGEHRAPLSSPDGAHLTGDLVTALAGEVQVAQADGNADAHKVIGHVTKLVGTATAIRNGVSIILNNGDNVEKGDVVTSGSDSTLGITFIDGTVFGLSSNARMVLNEMVYDPNGSNNSSLLSLVAGTITFVAGETAKHGDMKVDTPVATMGIRGTAVLVEIEFSVPGTTPDAKFQVLVEPDGTTGSYILFDKTTLTPLAVVDKAGTQINISNGIMSQTLAPLSPEIQKLINDVFTLKFSDNSNTKSLDHFTDTVVPTDGLGPLKFADLSLIGPVTVTLTTFDTNSPNSTPVVPPPIIPFPHIPNALNIATTNGIIVERAGAAGTGQDTVSGTIKFVDINPTDRPTVSTEFRSVSLQNAQGQDITSTLTATRLAQVEAALTLAANPGNNNNGGYTWSYSVPASALGSLPPGSTLTLTYNATVNNNYGPQDETVTAPITVTIKTSGEVWSETNEISSTAPGDWNHGANWLTGVAPTATDDVIILTDPAQGGTPFYPVTIKSAEEGGGPAYANSLTMGDLGGQPPELDNFNSLTIGSGGIHLNADSILNNFGTFSIGGLAEVLQHSVLQNSGLLTLEQGGDFKDQSQITNSGTIEVAGGTLNVEVDVANSNGVLQIDSGATLKLSGATIDGGTVDGPVNFSLFSSIDVTGPSTLDNASLNHGAVTIANGVTLTLDNDTVNGTTFNDTASGATIKIDDGTVLALTGVVIDGGIIDNGTVAGTTAPAFGSMDIIGQSTIDNAVLNKGEVTIASGVTLTLDNDMANGTTFNDMASGATIQIDDGAALTLTDATINGGIINDGSSSGTGEPAVFGAVAVTGSSNISNAFLNHGEVTVASDATLTLDNDTVNGTTFNDTASGATIKIDDGTVLALTGVAIDGGIIDNGTVAGTTAPAFGSMDIIGPSTIDNAVLNKGEVTIASGVTLTLDNDMANGTTFNDMASGATIQIDDGAALTLTDATINGGIINDGSSSGTGEPAVFGAVAVTGSSNISNAFLNHGEVTVASDATLTLSNDIVTSTYFNDAGRFGDTGSLALNGAAFVGTLAGTMDIGGAVTFQSDVVVNGGVMSIARGATLDIENPITGVGATLIGVDVFNSGTIQVDSAGPGTTVISLVLDGGTSVTGGTLLIHVNFPVNGIEGAVEIGAGGATFENVNVEDNNVLTIDDGATLTLGDSTMVRNGNLSIGALGVFDVEQGPDSLSGGTADATLHGVAVANGGTIEVGTLGAGGPILLLDGGTLVGNGALTIGSVGTLEIGVGGATLAGVAVENDNLLTIDDGNILTLSDNTVISSGNLTVGALGVLDIERGTGALSDATLQGVAVANDGNIEIGVAGSGESILLLEDATMVSYGALTVGFAGTLEIGAGGATLNDVTVINGNVIEVLAGNALNLDSGTTVVNFDATVTVDGTATLDLNGAVIAGGTLSGDGTIATVGGLNTFEDVVLASTMTVDVADNTILGLNGLIANDGVIALNSSGDATALEISGNVLLEGSGQVVLTDDARNAIVSDGSAATLVNGDTIAGAGTIGDALLTLVNDGHIDASGANALIIDTGVNTATSAGPEGSHWFIGSLEVMNDATGLLQAASGHVLQIDDNVLNNGLIQSGDPGGTSTAVVNIAGNVGGTGSINIFDHALVEIGGSVSAGQTVTFEVASGNAGLILDDPHDFQGLVQGLVEASSHATENYIDLKGFSYTDQTMVEAASFDAATGITAVTITNGSSANNLTIDLAGNYHNAFFEFASDGAGGTLFSDPAVNSGAVTINSNTTLDIAAASTATVSFANGNGTTGELVLGNSTAFTGSIAGFAGNGTISHSDLIDLADLSFASIATNKTTFMENGNDTGTLTLYNGSGQVLDSVTFDGNYQLANFTLENDGSGHTLILDPPASATVPPGNGIGPPTANSGAGTNDVALNSLVVHDPGPSQANSSTSQKPVWDGFAVSDNFSFNFAGGGHAELADPHPFSDGLPSGGGPLAAVQAALNIAHDEYANAAADLGGHDALSDIHKVLVHTGDFHVA